ncbi:MAG: bifunctional YncE family protein/alkaline phosphatase family protein [Pyrinomonadaceae bacterium]
MMFYQTSVMRRRSLFVISGLAIAILLLSAFIYKPFQSLANDEKFTDQTPSEGRPITPAGELVLDAATQKPAVGALTMNFARSPDTLGADGKGRYLLAVNSGFGVQFDGKSNRAEQSIAVIDLNAEPAPQVVQNVYFPTPQSVNFGVRFHPVADADGNFRLFVSGGFENKIRLFKFSPAAAKPISPASDGKDAKGENTKVDAPFIDVSAFATNAPSPNYNDGAAAVYPTGIALSPDGETLFAANNLGDTLGIISDLRDARLITRVNLQRPNSKQFVYPYDVQITPAKDGKNAAKVYVSLWGDGSIAVVNLANQNKVSHIAVDRHPTAMILNEAKTRLFVLNSNADSVSVIDTSSDKLIERINLKLAEDAPIGASPEGLALSEDEKTLYVANAHANAVAVVSILDLKSENQTSELKNPKSKLLGFIPTGQYASAVAVVGTHLLVANGKGTGFENSSMIVNNSGRVPNAPNELFPPKEKSQGGEYSVAIVAGNISFISIPTERGLFDYTQSVMRNNGLLGKRKTALFTGQNPIKHVIYIIKENRTYDQLYGDLETSGDGTKADGDAKLAIFGAGETAKSPNGAAQNITPNQRALALRFGLLDRFFVNSEASPDGHNWSTAAFSNDYIDKAFRWNYSGRGRSYDYEGFNRLPSFNPPANQPPVALPPVFDLPATENDIANFMKRYVPYLNGARDIGEPETLYLWDAAQRANLSYRNYGEYVATVSAEDVKEVNTRRAKKYPDISPTVDAFATKKSLENHFSATVRNFDMDTPDSLTTDSYRAAKEINDKVDAAITPENQDARFRGAARFGDWQKEFQGFAADLKNGRGDNFPNLSILRFSNDHTAGLHQGTPTPQFYVADNDYAVGRLVEEVSKSPFWKNTAIFVVEDDAQAGPDHVDAHRSPALVISAYNRKGTLVHDFHNTVSLIRTIEILLGIKPMNLLDATAAPIDIFQDAPDLTPFQAVLPDVALDNLFPPKKPSTEMQAFMRLTDEQDLTHEDMANPQQLNEIIWFSVRGKKVEKMPLAAKLPAFDLMTAGLAQEEKDFDDERETEDSEKRESSNGNP